MSQVEGLIGERLGSYRIDSILGAGAMGVVYKGTNEKNGRAVAVKVVSNEFQSGGKIHDRFEREAEILQQFRHPNIVRFLAVGRFRGTSYIAMELIQGDNLEKIVADKGALPWRTVVDLGFQTCEALHYAHERGVVHRDLKPSNLMVTTDGKIKLTDFGIAKDLDKTALTATGRTLGTAAYMAPEQIKGSPAISHKTDLYALGVVLYQMLVGKPPFEGNTAVVLMHCHLNEPAPRPSAKIQEIPRALDDLVLALMAKSPTDRPWDAAAVWMVLNDLKTKALEGKPIAMVWGEAKPKSAEPPRAKGANTTKSAGKEAKAKPRSGRTAARSAQANDGAGGFLTKARLEVAMLVAALLAVGGFIGYWVWPPSAGYLYRQAEGLMASTRRSDWVTAREDYLDPLDSRFPDNPYHEQTQKWRDKILLDIALGRSKVITSEVKIPFSEPANDIERQYVIAHTLATKASERGDDLRAIEYWGEYGAGLKADDPDQRPWRLLAEHQMVALKNSIDDRRQAVARQLGSVQAAIQAGKLAEAESIRAQLIKQYSRFTDLSDVFGSLEGAPDPASSEPTKPPPASDPKSPAAPPSEPSKPAADPPTKHDPSMF